MTGTLLNGAALLVGAGLGALLGGRVSARVRSTITDGLGLFVVVLGVSDALEAFGAPLREVTGDLGVLVVVGALLLGAVVGEALDIESALTRLGERLRDAVTRGREPLPVEPSGPDRDALEGAHQPHELRHRFVEGFVVTSLIVCVGPLAILGPLQDGLQGDITLLAVKSALDGTIALALASALGAGVAFAVLPLLALQGSIALAAAQLQGAITEPALTALSAVGGFLVIGIGLRLLEVREIRVANLLPALLFAPIAVALWP